MRTFAADLRLAVRTLSAAPGFSAAAVATLGLAIALSTTVAAVIDAYLFTQLPYPEAARLHTIQYGAPGQEQPRRMEMLDWTSVSGVLEHQIAWDLDMFYLLGGENAEAVPGAWVTPGFVAGLGIRPAIGSGFDARAFERGSGNVALISDRLWRSRFGGDPAAIGQPFTAYVSDRPAEAERFTVIGVLPAAFWHLNSYTDILAPLRAPTYPYMARLRDGVTAGEAADRISALVRGGAAGVPPGWTAAVVPTHESYVARVRPILRSVAAAAALVLLVGCANVAGLLLLRATGRRKEIAVRTALGASRGAIARMLLAEAVVLAVAATGAGLFGTALALRSLAPVVQPQLGRMAPAGAAAFAVDPRVISVAAAIGLVTAVLCALAPLAATRRGGLPAALQGRGRSTTDGRGSQRLRAGLVALQIAASLALVAGSTLMVRTVMAVLRADLGIDASRVLMASMTLRQSRYPDAPSRLALFERTLTRLSETAGAQSVALSSSWLLQQPQLRTIEIDGPAPRAAARAAVHIVSDAYFSTLSIPVRSGRSFTAADRFEAEPVAIVSETLARRSWPGGQSALGQRLIMTLPTESRDYSIPLSRVIVGVAADVRQDPADTDAADVYLPIRQAPDRFAHVLVRTSAAPDAWLPQLRPAFRDIDPEISLAGAKPMQDLVDEMRARPRFLASLLGAFATLAGFVAVVGVYGMMAYTVRQREREIAVRIAIGANPRSVMGLFFRQGGVVIGAGLALGLIGAAGAGRLLESQLFGVRASDPAAIGAAVLTLAASALLAVWWPSRRATQIDPVAALRSD